MANNHEYKGTCDLCNLKADSEVSEVVGLDCSFAFCDDDENLYHQACLEKYLKSIKLERNRRSGFPCPRGHGRCTRFPEKCKGKITKSHPVTIRGEGNKRRRQAELESLQKVVTPEAPACITSKTTHRNLPQVHHQHSTPASKPMAIKVLAKDNVPLTKLSPSKTAVELKKDAQMAAVLKLKAEIAAKKGLCASFPTAIKTTTKQTRKQTKTLDEYLAEKLASKNIDRSESSAGASMPTFNAWSTRASSSMSSGTGNIEANNTLKSTIDTTDSPHFVLSTGFNDLLSSYAESEKCNNTITSHDEDTATISTTTTSTPRYNTTTIAPAVYHSTGTVESPSGVIEVIPGMVAVAGSVSTLPLTKAQRKNLKRTEKKAAARQEHSAPQPTGSNFASESSQLESMEATRVQDEHHQKQHHQFLMDNEVKINAQQHTPPTAVDQCMERLIQHKISTKISELVALGFSHDDAFAAVMQHPNIDISAELQTISFMESYFKLPSGVIHLAVAECDGDLCKASDRLQKVIEGMVEGGLVEVDSHRQYWEDSGGSIFSFSPTNTGVADIPITSEKYFSAPPSQYTSTLYHHHHHQPQQQIDSAGYINVQRPHQEHGGWGAVCSELDGSLPPALFLSGPDNTNTNTNTLWGSSSLFINFPQPMISSDTNNNYGGTPDAGFFDTLSNSPASWDMPTPGSSGTPNSTSPSPLRYLLDTTTRAMMYDNIVSNNLHTIFHKTNTTLHDTTPHTPPPPPPHQQQQQYAGVNNLDGLSELLASMVCR